jgi:ABC-2 type transport system ATP-binding protein
VTETAAVVAPCPDGGTTEPAIRTSGLRKTYPDGVEAVRGVDLEVGPGELYGFLGPNGAGKTTTIMILCTLTRPTAGRVEVAGFDAVREPDAVRHRIGLLFQRTTLDPELTVAENLRFHADLYGLDRRTLPDRITSMLDTVGLTDRRDSLVATLSGGMARRVEIARGLLHRPRVLFLDEPTVGLDPHARAQVWTHLEQARRRDETTLFLTTHHLAEAERCDRIAIMDEGRVVVEGRPDELKAVLGADTVTLRTDDDAAGAAAIGHALGLEATSGPSGLVVKVADGSSAVPKLCAVAGVAIRDVSVRRPSLDDVFAHHTGRAFEGES